MTRHKSRVGATIKQSSYPGLALMLLGISFLTVSCGTGTLPGQSEGIYLPPTSVSPANPPVMLIPTATIPEAETTLVALPTSLPPCTNNLRFVEDLSIPDGSLVTPGEVLDKSWKVENNGSCNWDSAYRLKHVGGPEMDAPTEQALFPARSGMQASIRVIFTAPSEAGAHRSAWQAFSPDGTAFGDLIFIEIQVSG